MSLGLGLDLSVGRSGAAASAAIAAPFAAVNGPTSDPAGGSKYEGWSANYASQPTVATPVAFTASRQGYSATDSASADTTATGSTLDTLYVTTTVRQPWPNHASQSALTAALSDYIYSTDTVSGGVTNNSTLVSPKPIAKWALPGRRTVANSVRLEVVAAHRDAKAGKQISHVVFTATDGTHTVTATVATPTILGYTNDRNAVIGYGIDLNITALNDNASFTVDAIAYSRLGSGAASQRRTVDGTATNVYEFATQTYYKSTSRVSSPPLVYITATGSDAVVDANGVAAGNTKVSTNATTAKANAFASFKSAVEALKAATNVTGGITDGCEVRVSNVTVTFNASITSATYQTAGELTVTRDPLETKASCLFQWGSSAATSTRHQWLKFKDLTVKRDGNSFLLMNNTGQLVIENCDFDNNSVGFQCIGNSTITQFWIGTTITNSNNALLGAGTTPCGLVRGCLGTANNQHEAICVIGNTFSGAGLALHATRGAANIFVGFNKFHLITSSSFVALAIDSTGIAFIQNLFEFTSITTNPTLRCSADDSTSNLTHIVVHNNTFAGAGVAGRENIFYDETNSTNRVQKLVSYKGQISVAPYTKGDIFHGANDGNVEGFDAGNPSTFMGQWPFYYGVGCQGNFSNYATANPTSEAQVYPGRGSLIGASTSVPQVALATLFTSNQAVTFNGVSYTVGAGNGTYTLVNNVGNTAKGILETPMLSHTLDGVARLSANDHPGALSAA